MILQRNVNGEAMGFASVSYWIAAPTGVRMATLETGSFALLSVSGGAFPDAMFDIPDQIESLQATVNILEHVYRLGAEHRRQDVMRRLGVVLTLSSPPIVPPRAPGPLHQEK